MWVWWSNRKYWGAPWHPRRQCQQYPANAACQFARLDGDFFDVALCLDARLTIVAQGGRVASLRGWQWWQNAIVDALPQFGIELPATPERIWRLIRTSRRQR
jgi:hypothetical protein